MKAWIKTSCYYVDEETGYQPNLGGYETQVPCSLMKISFPDKVLVRAAGSPDVVNAIVNAKGSVTDNEARRHIQNLHPNSDLENVDTRDPEVDEMLKAEGFDPYDIRREIQMPERGKQVLQDQEFHCLEMVAYRRGKDRDIKPHKKNIQDGKSNDHNKPLDRLRKGHAKKVI